MPDYRKLRVYWDAQELVVRIAESLKPSISQRMPGLRRQLLRSAASIASNIAEGAAQRTPLQYARFLSIAIGSAKSHLSLAARLDVVRGDAERLQRDVERIRRMTFRLRDRVEAAAVRDGHRQPTPPTHHPQPPTHHPQPPAGRSRRSAKAQPN